MNLCDLRDRGYDIATNWQECNTKSIFILNTNNIKKGTKVGPAASFIISPIVSACLNFSYRKRNQQILQIYFLPETF